MLATAMMLGRAGRLGKSTSIWNGIPSWDGVAGAWEALALAACCFDPGVLPRRSQALDGRGGGGRRHSNGAGTLRHGQGPALRAGLIEPLRL